MKILRIRLEFEAQLPDGDALAQGKRVSDIAGAIDSLRSSLYAIAQVTDDDFEISSKIVSTRGLRAAKPPESELPLEGPPPHPQPQPFVAVISSRISPAPVEAVETPSPLLGTDPLAVPEFLDRRPPKAARVLGDDEMLF